MTGYGRHLPGATSGRAMPWPSLCRSSVLVAVTLRTAGGQQGTMLSPKIPEPERGRNWDLKSVRKADPVSLNQSSFEWGLFCFSGISDSGAIEMWWAWGSAAGLYLFTRARLCLAPRLGRAPARDRRGRVVLAEASWTIAYGSFSLPPVLPETLASPTGGSCTPLRDEFPGVWPERQSWDAEITFLHKLYAFFIRLGTLS